jgi:alpha-glucosidase
MAFNYDFMKKVKNSFLTIIAGLMACMCLQAQSTKEIASVSPNGAIRFIVSASGGNLNYRITFLNKPVIEPSAMDLKVDAVNLCKNAQIIRFEKYQIDETYATRGVHSMATNRCNGTVINLRSESGIEYQLDVRVFNDGVGFRFIVSGYADQVRTPDESTVFTIPEGSTVWFHDLYWHYEGIYAKKAISELTIGEMAAPPVTFILPDGAGYASITESALINYAGMALQAKGNHELAMKLGHDIAACYPFAHDYSFEEAQRLSFPATIAGTISTPWRVVLIGKDLNTMVNNDVITNLSSEPDKDLFPDGIATDWVKPGRAVWTWLDGGDRTVEGMKEFSRLAGKLGFEYNVVDAFWYRWTDEQIRDLVQYSDSCGVKIWLWRHGRDIRDPERRRAFFQRCHDLGIVGVKLDAFSHESKEFIDLYQDCLRDAAEFKIMVNFHGNNKPTGETRQWPNELTREGIRGLEYSRSQHSWSKHNTILPFTRLLVGHGDYTPMHFGDRRLETSWAHQIATAVIFTSPLLIYAAHPQNILNNPAVEMIKSIPAIWDETIVLQNSRIGELAAIARRKGDTWFLAILNGAEERSFQLPISFLNEGWYQAMVVGDRFSDPATVKIEKAYVRNGDVLPVFMRGSGGLVVRFTKY